MITATPKAKLAFDCMRKFYLYRDGQPVIERGVHVSIMAANQDQANAILEQLS